MNYFLHSGRRLCVGLGFAFVVPAAMTMMTEPALAGVASTPIGRQTATAMVADVPRIPVRDVGRAPSATQMNLAVVLKYRNESQLEAFIRSASDRNSPEYGHYLTPAQFADSFAPTVTDYERVAKTLEHAGFRITQTTPNRTVVDVLASAAVVEKYFSTEIHAVDQAKHGRRYANARPAYMPAELRDVAFGIAGFSNLIVAETQHVRASDVRADLALGPPLQGPDTGLGPFALATAYDFPVQHPVGGTKSGQTYDGTGHSAGIAIDSDLPDSDLASYLSYFKVKRTGPPLARVLVDGGPLHTFDAAETAIDVETIAGLAPGAGVYLYLMPQLSTPAIVDTYNRVVSDDKVDVLNSSFGGCEISTDNFAKLTDHVAEQGAAKGITFSASSGDFGADMCIGVTSNFIGVSAPASGPHFTAVGGTSLLVLQNGAYRIELGWFGSGGGVSTIFSLPPYQSGVKNILGTTRNVPDISFEADPHDGVSVFLNGAFIGPFGGTSVSSPVFSALVTEIDQVHQKRSGLINTALYANFKKSGYGSQFRDIIYGNNGFLGPGYNASRGYDNVTGLGSLVGWPYAQ